MANVNAPIPLNDPISRPRRARFQQGQRDPQEGLVTDNWAYFFNQQQNIQSQNPTRVALVQLTSQGGPIQPTAISGNALNAGLYRISYYTRVTQSAGTSSSLAVVFNWVENGVALTQQPQSALAGNSVLTPQNWTGMVFADANAAILYSTVYTSLGTPFMQYNLYIALEQINA